MGAGERHCRLHLAVFLLGTIALQAVSAGAHRVLLQEGRAAGPPCPGARYGWFRCQVAEHVPGNICVPLCQPRRGAACVACTDANATCNAAWPSFKGTLGAHFRVNSTQSCRAVSETLRVAQQLDASAPPSGAAPSAGPAAAPVAITATRDDASRVSLPGLAADPPAAEEPQAAQASAQPLASVQVQQAAAGAAAGGVQPDAAASAEALQAAQAAQAAQALQAQQLAAGAQAARPLGWAHGSYAQLISPRLSSPGGTASSVSALGR